MAISGGKDLRVSIWDLRSGICVQSLKPILAEVSSVCADDSFTRILAAVKNNTNRIWDLRAANTSLSLKGHQNSSKLFVRAIFGPQERTVISGSENSSDSVGNGTASMCSWETTAGPTNAPLNWTTIYNST
jgi:WD40 repeat protein